MKPILLAAVFLSMLAPLARSASDDPSAPHTFDDLGLTITPPKLDGMRFEESKVGQIRGSWRGNLGTLRLDIALIVLPNSEFGFAEPEDVMALIVDNLRDPQNHGDPNFKWDDASAITGPFGWVPVASLARGSLRKSTQVIGTRFMFCSMLEKAGYAIEVDTEPEAADAQIKAITEFFKKGIVYKGPTRDSKWSDAAVKERWEHDASESAQKHFKGAFRTEHYIILSNSDGAKLFAKKAEENYAAIRKAYPFDEIPGRKLLPIFLFSQQEEYYDFYEKIAHVTRDNAAKSKGHAWRDYYATYYDSPVDAVHIHEMTHQLFANRLHLGGGGSWFQEGLAEYMSTLKTERNVTASQVKKGRHVPVPEFVKIKSLLYSSKEKVTGEGGASDNYLEAALLIEFLKESKFGAAKFQSFTHAVGLLRGEDAESIEKAVQGVYGVDLKGLDDKWIEYCKKR
jgi:hypothetical protein